MVKTRYDREQCDHDAAERSPHVPRRDVAPPAVVEAEEDEDGELDPDDEQQDRPVEVASRRRPGRVWSKRSCNARYQACGDERRVGRELPEPMPVERTHHAPRPPRPRVLPRRRAPAARRAMPGPERDEKFSRAARSVSGSDALLVPEEAQRRLEVERRHVVVAQPICCSVSAATDRVSLGRAGHEQVVDVAGLVDGHVARARRGRARDSAPRPRAARASSRRARAGTAAAPRPGSRPAASCSRRTRRCAWPSSRGSGACGRARRAPRRSTATSPPSPRPKRFFVG